MAEVEVSELDRRRPDLAGDAPWDVGRFRPFLAGDSPKKPLLDEEPALLESASCVI